jgi:hypothetical protein
MRIVSILDHISILWINVCAPSPSCTKFDKNLPWWGVVVPCGRKNGRTDIKEHIVAFHSFANSPKTLHSAHVVHVFIWISEQAMITSLYNMN